MYSNNKNIGSQFRIQPVRAIQNTESDRYQISLTGTLTGDFDLTSINWVNDDAPGAGTFLLTWLDNKLVLTVSGLSFQEWFGTNGTGIVTITGDVSPTSNVDLRSHTTSANGSLG